MKKFLFATSALVAFAGAASAEVAVTGEGRLGLRYESDLNYTGDSSWNVVNRVRVIFTMTGESDAGLSFGAKLRADQAASANSGDNNSAVKGTVWVSGAYGKLTAGDIDGALEQAVGDLPEVGLSGLDFWNEFAYAGSEERAVDADANGDGVADAFAPDAGLLYEYTIGNASIYASMHDAYYGNTDVERDSNSYSLGVGYTLGDYTFGIGYEKSDYTLNPFVVEDSNENLSTVIGPLGFEADSDTWGISGGTSFQGVTFKAAYLKTSSDDDALDHTQYGLGAEYKMANGVGIAAFWRKNDFSNVDVDGDALGLGASYDIGGGATLKAGIVRAKVDALGIEYDNTLADAGLEFKF